MCPRIDIVSVVSLIAFSWLNVGSIRASDETQARPRVMHRLPYSLPQHGCGVYSFLVCGRSIGRSDLTVQELLDELAPIGPNGVSMDRLAGLAEGRHIPACAVVLQLDQLLDWNRPAILHVDQHHYVAFLGTSASSLVLFDSRTGLISCPVERFANMYDWQGKALVFGGPPALWERLLQWPNVGLLALGVLLVVLAAKLIKAVV